MRVNHSLELSKECQRFGVSGNEVFELNLRLYATMYIQHHLMEIFLSLANRPIANNEIVQAVVVSLQEEKSEEPT